MTVKTWNNIVVWYTYSVESVLIYLFCLASGQSSGETEKCRKNQTVGYTGADKQTFSSFFFPFVLSLTLWSEKRVNNITYNYKKTKREREQVKLLFITRY